MGVRRKEEYKMALKDNREFIDALHKAGELVRVKQETDWDCEIGAKTPPILLLS